MDEIIKNYGEVVATLLGLAPAFVLLNYTILKLGACVLTILP